MLYYIQILMLLTILCMVSNTAEANQANETKVDKEVLNGVELGNRRYDRVLREISENIKNKLTPKFWLDDDTSNMDRDVIEMLRNRGKRNRKGKTKKPRNTKKKLKARANDEKYKVKMCEGKGAYLQFDDVFDLIQDLIKIKQEAIMSITGTDNDYPGVDMPMPIEGLGPLDVIPRAGEIFI